MSDEDYLEDSSFPGNATGLPPLPSKENPGRVFPKTDPSKEISVPSTRRTTPDQYVGNPFLMNSALDKLDHAFGEVIAILEEEDRSQDQDEGGNVFLRRFISWRQELERIRSGEEDLSLTEKDKDKESIAHPIPTQASSGGLFTD